MGKAVTLTKGKSILIGDEHWVTVNQIDSHGKNVRLYVESPSSIRVVNDADLPRSKPGQVITSSKT